MRMVMLAARLLCCWLVGVASQGRAQVNAETLAENVSAEGFGGAGKSTIGFSSGNVSLFEARGEASLFFATHHPDAPKPVAIPGSTTDADPGLGWFLDRVILYGSAGRRTVNGTKVANDGYAHLRYTRMQWLRVGAEVFAQAQYDDFRLLQRRLLLGAGLRVVTAAVDHFRSWFGTGYMAEDERRNIAPENRPPLGPDRRNVINHRWTSYLTLIVDVLPDKLSFVTTAYVQPRIDYFRDVQILHEAHLQVHIAEHVDLTVDSSIRYDSRPPRTIVPRDIRIGNGLQVAF